MCFLVPRGADLASLVREASTLALQDCLLGGDSAGQFPGVHNRHFEAAFREVRPSVSEKDYRKFRERVREKMKDKIGQS